MVKPAYGVEYNFDPREFKVSLETKRIIFSREGSGGAS
jgi:tRNA U34 5-carboxymethylaminomethyl modifying enzyme MnmG/GidA